MLFGDSDEEQLEVNESTEDVESDDDKDEAESSDTNNDTIRKH